VEVVAENLHSESEESNEELLTRFIESRLNAGRTERGVEIYVGDIRRFVRFLEDRNGPDEQSLHHATVRDVEAWSAHMRLEGRSRSGKKVGNKQNTRRIRLCAVEAIARYADLPIAGRFAIPPRDLKATEDVKRNVLEKGEYDELVKGLEEAYRFYREKESHAKVRNLLMVMLGVETAMRSSEITGLDLGDVYLSPLDGNPSITINGKGARQRTMRLSEGLYEAIRDYVEHLRPEGLETSALFVSNRGNRMGSRSLLNAFYKWTERLTGRKLGIHDIRRSTITTWHRQGHDPVIIQRWAGHQDVATTYQCYIAVTPRDQQRAEELRLSRKSKRNDGKDDGSGLQERMKVLVQLWRDGILSEDEFKNKMDRLVM
jgi:integrase/recombinase XerC